MQKSILAASVLALASGTVVIPKSHTKSSMSKAQAKVRHAEFHARDKNTAKNVAAVLEQDGVSLKNHNEKYKYFEMSMGEADCQQTVATVEGNTMFRCIDMLWDYSEENGYPTPPVTESEGMYYPSNGGFPINVWFHGHGCNEDNMGGTWRMNKQDMGFPATYKPEDGCIPIIGAGGTPMYYMEAKWLTERSMPMFDAVWWGADWKEKSCKKEKYFEYGYMRAGVCFQDGTENFLIDVSECADDKVTERIYSDNCQTETDSQVHKPEECLFELDDFMEAFDEGPAAYFLYQTQKCYQAAV